MKNTDERYQVLSQVDLFHDLPKRALRSLASASTPAVHQAGKEIVEEGGMPMGFHVIVEGHATVIAGERERRALSPGDYFGIVSLIDGNPRSATIRADTELRTLFIAPWVFHPMLDEEPSLARHLLNSLCMMLRSAEDAAVEARSGKVPLP